MVRTSPCYYIAPTAISISPNANGSASDLAVNVVKGTKIKVYSLGISALGYSDTTFQQWTLAGRNRRLADNSKPYSIYARLAKTNKEDGYLVFAPKVADGDKWLDKYAYVTIGGLATGTANKNSDEYWYIKLGEVSLPVDNTRNVTLDTGILGTDRFNTEWNIDPDQMPLRIELSATIESKDAGDRPYVEWGKRLVLQAKLLEGWANANVQRFSHFTIQRNTGNASADTAYNYPDEKSSSERPSSGRQMPNGLIVLSHARGSGDVFDGTVSSTWTVIAWGVKTGTTNSTSSNSASSKDVLSSSSSTNGVATADQYEMLAEKSINIMAETVEQYTLELSASVVNYDPGSDTYTPANGVDAMVRATDQKGEVFKLTKAQLEAANLVVQYSIANLDQWNDCKVTSATTDVAKANVPIEAFRLQQNVNVRLVKAQSTSVSTSSASSTSSTEVSKTTYKEIYRSHIALIRNGEDSKEREWIFLRSTVELSFAATADGNHKLLPSLIKGGEVKPKEAAAGTDTNKNQDGWVPQGWWDDSLGTNETYLYEYTAYRDYIKGNTSDSSSSGDAAQRGGHWGDFSTPRIWSHYGKDAVTYGVQLSSTYETWSDAKKHAGIKVTFTKTTGTTVSSYGNVQVLGTAKVYADGTEIKGASDHLNSGYNRIIFDSYTFDGTNNTPSIGTASVITVELLVGGTVVATANYSNGKQGDGVVMAYKHADTQPGAPTGTDPEYPGDGWSLSPDAATAREKVTDVSYGGYESGTYDGTNKGTDATAKEWTEAEDDGRTWMKSPSGLSDNFGYALMKVSFTTQYDNTTVDVEIKAYSEQSCDYVELWALDTAPDTGTSFRGHALAHASGNGVEQAYSFTVAKAGQHFICVTYAKDTSLNKYGDYGLFRLDLSDNEVAVSDTVWMSQAKVSGGKCVLPWSTPVKINGADGIGAFEILCDPETIVIDTDDKGLATGLDNASASLMCLRDGKEVSGVTYKKGLCVNCGATVNTNTGVVTITSVRKQSVTVDGQTVEVSCTSGSVTVLVTDPTTKTTYVKTIPFTVDVAKFNGGLKADNKRFETTYNYLTNNGTSTDFSYYESHIKQTAKDISLHVSEKRAGRRNLLPGSAFRKQGEGCKFLLGKDGYGIQAVGGYEGTNCVRALAQGDNYAGVFWQGGGNGTSKNIKIKRNTRYTLSVWAKAASASVKGIFCEAIYEKAETVFARDGGVSEVRHSYPTVKAGEWQQFMLTVQTDGSHDWMECNFWATTPDSSTAIDVLFCRPMLEEGDEYNGWTLSEQDYDYVGGNLLDNAGTLVRGGNLGTLRGTLTQNAFDGNSAVVNMVTHKLAGRVSTKTSLPTSASYGDYYACNDTWRIWKYTGTTLVDNEHYNGFTLVDSDEEMLHNDFLAFSLELGDYEDYVVSWYAKGDAEVGVFVEGSGQEVTVECSDGFSGDGMTYGERSMRLTSEWKRYWAHFRKTKGTVRTLCFRQYRNDDNTASRFYLSQPKLEVGATMTEWTAKRSDMVDKQALYATGIDIDSKKITLTADHTYVRTNDGTPMVMIDADGNLTNVKVNADMVNVSATHKLSISGNGSMVVNMDNFNLNENGDASFKGSIDSTSGTISFFTFTESGMYSATSSPLWGLGLVATNISVRGNPGGRTSLVCLGDGHKDTTGGNLNTYPKSLVNNSQNVNYCNLIQVTGGGPGNGRDAAALGIETEGDYCLSAMGGLSHLQGLALDASTTTNGSSPNRTLFLCSGGHFTMPSNPKNGQLVIVIQTRDRIDFNGNGHRFQSGTYNSLSFTSDSAGQWSLFYYHNEVWYTIYMTR